MATLARDQRGDETGADELRRRVHRMWAAVAPSWGEHAAYVDARGAEVVARMFELAAPAPGERVLELACGPGGLGLAAAPLVLPGGEVVLSDVAEEMTAIAGARARALGLENVSTTVLDLEAIDQPDASYDVVLCREGLMFAVDPVRAAREIARVLRPGGRSPRGLGAAGPQPLARPGLRGRQRAARQAGAPARCARSRSRSTTPDRLVDVLRQGGLREVVVARAADAASRRLVRGVVAADERPRRPAHRGARVAAGAGAAGPRGAAARGRRPLRDA